MAVRVENKAIGSPPALESVTEKYNTDARYDFNKGFDYLFICLSTQELIHLVNNNPSLQNKEQLVQIIEH